MLIIVPKLKSLSNFSTKIIIIGIYVINGDIMFVLLSATRYAACTTSGVILLFAWYNIGTNIGASKIHLADALPINKLINAVSKINTINNNIGYSPNPDVYRKLAPLQEINFPIPEWVNIEIKFPAKKATAITPALSFNPEIIMFTKSFPDLILPTVTPYANPGIKNAKS